MKRIKHSSKKRRSPGQASDFSRPPLRVFISYSHEDFYKCDQLRQHLALLVHQKLIELWFDGLIDPRYPWDSEIKSHLAVSDIVIMLISARFLSSFYCYETEMREALLRHKMRKSFVLPVIIGACDWIHAPFSFLNSIPSHGKPISGSRDRRDEGWTLVARKVRHICSTYQNNSKNTHSDTGGQQR